MFPFLKFNLKSFFRPVNCELPFFLIIIFLIDYWGIYQAIRFPSVIKFIGFDLLSFLSISVVCSYFFTLLVYISKSRLLKLAFYLIGILMLCVDSFHYFSFNYTVLSPVSIMLVMETNAVEIRSFFDSFLLTSTGCISGVIAFFLFFICYIAEKWKLNLIEWGKRHLFYLERIFQYFFLIFFAFGFFSFYCYFELFNCQNLSEIDAWREKYSKSCDRITNIISCYYYIHVVGNTLEIAENSTKIVLKNENKYLWTEDSVNVILVVGESYNKNHSNLYGYLNNTNPMLRKEQLEGNLFVFTDAISPNRYTLEALRDVFSTNSVGNGEQWYDHPFFPSIFHNAGYRVLFWDNQYIQSWNGYDFTLNSYIHSPIISEMAYDVQHPFVSMYDGKLIENFDQYWKNYNKGKCNFIIFHLQGQHLNPEEHYPQVSEFQHFNSDSILRTESWMTDIKKERIAHYDNCTLYNDFVIGQILSLFRNESSVIVYFSDHGENVFDLGDSYGRVSDAPYFYEVPFYVWCSDKYMLQHKEIIDDIRGSTEKPMMIDNVCHLLMHVGGLLSPYHKSSRDALSKDYKCPPRIISVNRDYDKIKNKKKYSGL